MTGKIQPDNFFCYRKGQRWFCCPYCEKALFPVRDDARVEGLVLRCKACGKDVVVKLP